VAAAASAAPDGRCAGLRTVRHRRYPVGGRMRVPHL